MPDTLPEPVPTGEAAHMRRLYKLRLVDEPTGMMTAKSASCSFCGTVFFRGGGGGTFICSACVEKFRGFDAALSAAERRGAAEERERQSAVNVAAEAWGKASAALEEADKAVAKASGDEWKQRSREARAAWEAEQNALSALRAALDARSRPSPDAGGEQI